MNSHVELVDGLVDGFGADQNKFKALLCAKAEEIADQVDVILLAQGSMAYAEDAIHEKIGKPVLSSPRFGAQALAKALQEKGMSIRFIIRYPGVCIKEIRSLIQAL